MWLSRGGSRNIEHAGSAHDEQELPALKAAASERLVVGQAELHLGLGGQPARDSWRSHVVTDELPLGGLCNAMRR